MVSQSDLPADVISEMIEKPDLKEEKNSKGT
jgi:hypothetical protein